MKNVLDEPKVESNPNVRSACAGFCDPQELAERMEKGVDEAKAAVSEKLEDGQRAAERLMKRGRYAVEDGVSEAAHHIKRHPGSSVAIAFAAGAALSFLFTALRKESS
jgi:ElaB/YqjD/DUF883 family membrane-anchored ribosome-binding protein